MVAAVAHLMAHTLHAPTEPHPGCEDSDARAHPRSNMHVRAQVLDLCSDEELEAVYNVLHASSPLSPVVKSLVAESEPALLELRGRVGAACVGGRGCRLPARSGMGWVGPGLPCVCGVIRASITHVSCNSTILHPRITPVYCPRPPHTRNHS